MQPIKRTIYLAGPISGLNYETARNGWRRYFATLLPEHIACYSPMRAKEFLAGQDQIEGSYPEIDPLATEAGIVTRDHNDVFTNDAIVACFLEDNGRPSLGTAIEFGWAHAYNKPIVMVAEKGNIHREHPMLSRMAGYIVDNLEDGARIMTHLLTPGI